MAKDHGQIYNHAKEGKVVVEHINIPIYQVLKMCLKQQLK
jgi:hypothetical protein